MPQTTLTPFAIKKPASSTGKREALSELSGNASKKAKNTLETRRPDSATLRELKLVTKEVAQDTLKRLRDGYTDKSGSSYPAAVITPSGCILCQKKPNRAENGYIQIAPISTGTRAGTKNGITAQKPLPQNAHWLAVVAYKSEEEIEGMLAGAQASHLCHNPLCINPDHITVEEKAKNEARKGCAGRVAVRTVIAGQKTGYPADSTYLKYRPKTIPTPLRALRRHSVTYARHRIGQGLKASGVPCTRLALQLFLVKGFKLYSFQLQDPKEPCPKAITKPRWVQASQWPFSVWLQRASALEPDFGERLQGLSPEAHPGPQADPEPVALNGLHH
ncbi:hypothetical protein G7Y89_g13083 [Cudoniella acicularis]|uniref:Zinc-binding loop region of homing endonuclease domain-containing protein n=1 Tax=Cudoniella acicularis TaxID=354080 RepID=A0A8H4RAK8_9HELO|nr:hypothetical protein G7Y89_g13083 [Cudoniella acicularis]